ncbi:MAG TPA: glycosyltransferase [Acidocella sp.]|jgi:succinoglycan biosynthesis protein ExoO|uniref:glycosyltransferase family 2 protein n=1 Tax=Acidocella sp. TaxID=50710 RepID=UPI002C25EA05|nr:glycosyltransferase [Acidocella sp.]HVE21406.1 glycosyltransferase [Acidocella sp.]
MMGEASVSVIIAAYNAEAFISRAIASALTQTLPPREILIVDDCSTDGTRAVLDAAVREHPTIKVIAMARNGGPSAARNAGIAQARGDWLAVLDADDAFAPTRLATLTAFAESTGADFVADDLAYYDAVADSAGASAIGDTIVLPDRPLSLRDYLSHNLADGRSFDWGLLKPIFRRDALIQRDIAYDPDVRHGEDFRLVVELLLSGAQFRILPQPLYLYTQRQGAVSGRPSGMTRTTIAYRKLKEAALTLARDPRIASDPEMIGLLQQRASGLARLDDAHFISTSLRAGAFGEIAARTTRDPAFLPFMLRQIGRAMRRRFPAL